MWRNHQIRVACIEKSSGCRGVKLANIKDLNAAAVALLDNNRRKTHILHPLNSRGRRICEAILDKSSFFEKKKPGALPLKLWSLFMLGELVQLSFDKIMQTRSYTVVILSGRDKRFAIYTDPSIGRVLQLYLTGTEKPRPLTHDLIAATFSGLNVRIKQVVINDIQDTIYFARLFLEQRKNEIRHIIEIDSRPSDSITLALMSNAPVYCTAEVLAKTVPVED